MRPPASMIAWRAGGSGTTSQDFPVVRLTTFAPSTTTSSPSEASTPGAVMMSRPRLIAFWRKIRETSLATIVSSHPFRQETACSREEPQPGGGAEVGADHRIGFAQLVHDRRPEAVGFVAGAFGTRLT
jgi:hypothetical protein